MNVKLLYFSDVNSGAFTPVHFNERDNGLFLYHNKIQEASTQEEFNKIYWFFVLYYFHFNKFSGVTKMALS